MKIAAYCRVSTEKEAQIDSLEKQIEFFNEFTKKNGYELYKLYADEGISGKQIKNRKQFQQMMKDAKAKKFERVVVKDVSRFARNTVDLLQSIRELKSYGIQVDFLNNGEVMEGGSEFILTILGAMAQQESANMSKRVKFGKDITAQKGRVPNLVFGYDKIPNERYTLKINEEEAKIVKEIFESYVYKGIGTTKIAWDLNDRGIRTKKTKSKWVQTSIVRMLKNPIYTGRVTNKKSEITDFITGARKDLPEEDWIKVENMHEAIISKEDFERAKKVIQATKGSRVVQNDYLFKGLLRCYDCKGYIGIRSPDKNGNIYGRCQRYGRFGKFDVCSPHNFNYQVFEEQMLEVLREVCKEYTNTKKLEEIAKQTKTKQSKEIDIKKQIESFKQQVESETRKLEVMYDDRLAGIITLEEYMKNANRIKELVRGYEQNIKELEQELSGESDKTKKDNRLDNLIEEFLNMEKPTKEIIREFIEKIEIHSDKQVDIYFNFKPLQDLNNNFICARKEYEKKVG